MYNYFMFLDCGTLLCLKKFQKLTWFELYREQKFTYPLTYRCNKIAQMMNMK